MQGYKLFTHLYSNTVKTSFNKLSIDSYYNNKRYRGFSLVDTNNYSLIGNPLFMQNANYNNYLGNKVRSYPNIHFDVIQDKSFQHTINTFKDTISTLNKQYTKFYIHQIRVITDTSDINVVPEGIHRDGYDYICISCVNKYSINPIYNEIYDKMYTMVDTIELNENENLILNDLNYYHNVTNLSSSNKKITGYRDIFVFTTFS